MKQRDPNFLFELAELGKEEKAREACPDCGPKRKAERLKKRRKGKIN